MPDMFLKRLLLTAAILLGVRVQASAQPAAAPEPPPCVPVYEAAVGSFDAPGYGAAVEALFARFEKDGGHPIRPGPKGRVGLKVYADSGPGLATPPALVQAVIEALQRRGFGAGDIFLVGLNQLKLRLTGYLPAFATNRALIEGHPVFVLESGRYYDPVWYYDSPLPSRFTRFFNVGRPSEEPLPGEAAGPDDDRKSFLATPLFLEADFWINLPVCTDHPVIGINGALVNATLWNASNTSRFFRSPANAPAAIAEMAAIPELRQGWIFTLVSLERYQFIGGPVFNSLYTRSEPLLWLSRDPVLMDSLMAARIDRARKKEGFDIISNDLRVLDFSEQLGIGTRDGGEKRIIRVE